MVAEVSTGSGAVTTVADLTIQEVISQRQMQAFVDFPWQLYRNDPLWVPPLKSEVSFKLNRAAHPYYQHADLVVLIATRQEQVVGRIAVCINHNHNERHREHTAFFGFFECIDDTSVSAALFDAAECWAKKQGCRRLLGPLSMSIDDEVGFLLEGDNRPPVMQMPYNPPYYHSLCLQQGYRKAKDLFAWHSSFDNELTSYDAPDVPGGLKSLDFQMRSLRPKELAAELERIMTIYNTTFTQHWGYVPLTSAEIRQMHDDLKDVLNPDLIILGESGGEVIAFAIALPNYNEILPRLNGKLGLTGTLKFLWLKQTIKSVRFFVVGVDAAFRDTRLATVMMEEMHRRCREQGYQWLEMSWTLEDNTPVNRLIERTGSQHYKTYRVYEKYL